MKKNRCDNAFYKQNRQSNRKKQIYDECCHRSEDECFWLDFELDISEWKANDTE